MAVSSYFVLFYVVIYMVKVCEGGECCRAHTNILATMQDEKWCNNYCCLHLSNVYDCCDNVNLRAPASERKDFCPAFFAKNIWAPILIAICGLALIICLCVCCWKCCRRSRETTVILQPLQQPSMVVMHRSYTGIAGRTDPYNAGYYQ